MTTPRFKKIDLASTPFYHIMSRCVRRTFLCGIDNDTGRDYSHRKEKIVSRIKYLAEAFAINVAAYAVMSNHYHLVLHVDEEKAKCWQDDSIINRWCMIFPNDASLIESLHPIQAQEKIQLWRERLTSISWFMKCLNEYIAKSSNLEDDCKGHFWEGRFKSQALLDEGAVLVAMAYVDLNPIRSKSARTLENSEFTSIQERIQYFAKQLKDKQNEETIKNKVDNAKQPLLLMPFANGKQSQSSCVDFRLSDYIELVEATGKIIRDDKRGAIPSSLPPLLNRLQLNAFSWLDMVMHLESKFFHGIGQAHTLCEFSLKNKDCLPRGISAARECYQAVA